jgi:hypothetical protein
MSDSSSSFTKSDSASSDKSDGSVSTWPGFNGKTIAEYSVISEYGTRLTLDDDTLGDQGNSFAFKLDSENASSTGDNCKLFFHYGHGNALYSCRKSADKNNFFNFHFLRADKEISEVDYTNLKIMFMVNLLDDEGNPLLAWFMQLRDVQGSPRYVGGWAKASKGGGEFSAREKGLIRDCPNPFENERT